MLLLPLILVTMPFQAYAYNYFCWFFWGPLSASDARAAANLIPAPSVDIHATVQSSNGSIIDDLTPTLQVRYPVVFHSGNAAIVIHQSPSTGIQERLLISEQVFYLWPAAKATALHIIQNCVDTSQGVNGGRAYFEVTVPGYPTRSFRLVIRAWASNSHQFVQGYQIWPAVGA